MQSGIRTSDLDRLRAVNRHSARGDITGTEQEGSKQNEMVQRPTSAAADRYLVAYLGARICAPAISLPRRTVIAGGVGEMEE
jgi:hypothetical protein